MEHRGQEAMGHLPGVIRMSAGPRGWPTLGIGACKCFGRRCSIQRPEVDRTVQCGSRGVGLAGHMVPSAGRAARRPRKDHVVPQHIFQARSGGYGFLKGPCWDPGANRTTANRTATRARTRAPLLMEARPDPPPRRPKDDPIHIGNSWMVRLPRWCGAVGRYLEPPGSKGAFRGPC